MFNQPFLRVQAELPRLSRLGFSHVLVSPPQKSHASLCWWGRYQPVDFRSIEGPLGNREQLQRLCEQASRQGLTVVVDTVLQHMSNETRYVRMRSGRVLEARFPQFSAADFLGPGECPRAYHGRGKALPVLRTSSPWVRQQLRDYVCLLYNLGVRGFRFDAAKHLDPDLLGYLLEGLPKVLAFGELVYARSSDIPGPYFKHIQAYDFPLARTLKVALETGGDLRTLMHPEQNSRAVWGPQAVTFVNHHDLVKNRRDFSYFRLGDAHDRRLAYLYILARGSGTPLIYGGDLRMREIAAGLAFHNQVLGQSVEWLSAHPHYLVWSRGRRAVAALNKSARFCQTGPFSQGPEPGIYRDLLSGRILALGPTQGLTLPPRSALLLVRQDA